MTSEKLYRILDLVDTLDSKLDLQANLEATSSALNDLVDAPAVPQYQAQLANALGSFESATRALQDAISPSQMAAIEAMGGKEFFDPEIFSRVRNAVQTNAMTPSVASNIVKDIASRRSRFLTTVRSAKQSLEKLNVTESGLQVGGADLAFVIPRSIFKNELGSFARELAFINRLMEHFNEAITGEVRPAELEQLSSSDPTVALLAAIPVISTLGEVVNMFLETWKKVEEIRAMRTKLSEMGLKGAALNELTEQVETTVDEVVEESTKIVMAKFPGESGRKAELENAIRSDTHRLFGQIERGLTVEIRANADDAPGDDSEQGELKKIANLAKTMIFPEPAKQPMLLASGEIVDGEIAAVSYSKKTTTSKKTVIKKTAKDGSEAVEAKE